MAFVLFLLSCNDKDEYYERPSWLEPPIYNVLAEKGNFTMYLKAIDRTLYSSVLKQAGNYTVFAPNDDAFHRFLSERGYESIDAVPVEVLTDIVSYSMVFNKFESVHLGDVIANKVWSEGTSIKKRSSYYKTLYKETINGKEEWIVDSPTDVSAVVTPYKYLPIFTQSYFSSSGLNALDYEAFFPESGFVGLNASGGRILTKDMYAENGVIHEVDAVNCPLDNLDEMLKQENHKAFRELLESKVEDSYLFLSYVKGKDATEVYKKLYPDRNISEVYCKTYINLPYLLNNEDYKGKETGTTEQQGYTLLVPSNEAVNAFTESVIRRAEVEKISDLSLETLTYFMQAHMVSSIVWPSQFQTSVNENGEYLNGGGQKGMSFDACVSKSTFASNGVLYDVPNVVKSKYFNTVYSEILLNRSCRDLVNVAYTTYFTNDWIAELTKSPLTGFVNEDYTLLLPSDELLANDGYSYDEVNKKFLNPDASAVSVSVDDRLKRLLRMCIIKRTAGKTELRDFSGSPELGYDGYGFAVNAYGDMIRFKDNKVQGIGNILDNVEVEVEELTDFAYNNGRVFKINKLLQYSPRETVSDATGWKDGTIYDAITNYTAANA
ncbi:MAG: fasciclin domain-containing protein, partial [Bacteroides xylanisolvens]